MAIFGLKDHTHDSGIEKDHLRNTMIFLFAGAFLLLTAYAVLTHQITFEGTLKASDIWQLFTVMMSGLFTWMLKSSYDKWKQGQNGDVKPTTSTP